MGPRRGGPPEPDLFAPDAARLRAQAPLATRMRPASLEEFLGQARILAPGTALRQAIEADRLGSFILWGPPGSGKTTLAHIIAARTSACFQSLSAVSAGVAEVRGCIAAARERLERGGQRTVLFIDEIHRHSQAQQDALLPAVEDGVVHLIGATTENPYFELTGALLSRCRVYRLEPLSDEEISGLLDRALADQDRGLGWMRVTVTPEARAHLIRVAGGDARTALNALELAAASVSPGAGGEREVGPEAVADAAQRRAPRYDRAGDGHYDTASAFIKSMRGSDPDAAIYWMARMIDAGEDPVFIARRIVIAAAEEVGNADPQALVVATAAAHAAVLVGLPEARIPLAQAAIYVATAPKSNSSLLAIDAALEEARRGPRYEVPLHLRNAAHPALARQHGYGQGYRYPHDHPDPAGEQTYLPPPLAGATYYRPRGNEHPGGPARTGPGPALTGRGGGDSIRSGEKP